MLRLRLGIDMGDRLVREIAKHLSFVFIGLILRI